MCYLCDQDRLLNTYGVDAGYLQWKAHYQAAAEGFLLDGVGDTPRPLSNALLVVTTDTAPDDTTTTLTVTVDAPAIVSTIDTIGDQDFYKVDLVAGQTYDISLLGKVGGPGGVALPDALVEIYAPDGTLITSADGGADTPLNALNSGFDALLTFTAQVSGTYYVNARAFDNAAEDGTNGDLVGDYELAVANVTGEARYVPYYDADNPLYSLDWGSQVDGTVRNPDGAESGHVTGNAAGTPDDKGHLVGASGASTVGKNVITIYFAKAGDVFTPEDPTSPGLPPVLIAVGAQQFERDAVFTSLREFEKVADVVYVEVQTREEADFIFATYSGTPGPGVSLLGSMAPPGETDEGLAQFNSGDYRWNPTDLQQGGFSFVTLIHEFGHGHGMAHPHDNGGRSGIMNGVVADGPVADYTTGDFSLNQAVFTMMSYQDGWQESPHGNAPTDVGYGYLGGLMAFDIAVIQDKYGVNEEYATGDDVYTLKDVNAAGTFYTSIWDAGGRDTIVYAGARNTVIDLRAATLEYETGGGGFVSFASGIFGGFTIANGVTIERATGGSGNDVIVGNEANNVLDGGLGNDVIDGGAGNDALLGRGGVDTASYGLAASGVRVSLLIEGGQDTIGAGTDRLVGIENLVGSAFADTLIGDTRSNRLTGGAGGDALFGGDGNDWLTGGAGVDRLTGGAGADRYLFADGDIGATAATADRILGFSSADRDRIDLTGIDADTVTAEDQAFTFIGSAEFSNTAGELRLTMQGTRFVLTGDTDGNGTADFMIIGTGEVPIDRDLLL